MFEWQRWSHRVVRDLAWVIASPPLVAGEFEGVTWWDKDFVTAEYQACLPMLSRLDEDPRDLVDYLAQQKGRALGHRFEALVGYWLMISPNLELLHRGVQLHHEGRTLGELDFILQDKRTEQVIHLEVAVKFFMGLDPLEQVNRWYGSNLKDSLDSKLAHLKTKQTQLSLHYPERLPVSVDQRCCCVKGRLFYPEAQPLARGPALICDDHLRGVWGTDAKAYAQCKNAQLIPVMKSHWFSELDALDIREMLENPVQRKRGEPQCFVLVNAEGEFERYFEYPEGYFDLVL
ncbi:DUF1853 family protein [Leucothrix sargassi]|nr:DUF1853 family protein [Leucothrix sargassi]